MPVRTKRWNDPASPDDGFRLLICLYRPRGVRKENEPWDAWCPALGPSKALHAAVYGKRGEPLPFAEYERAFREEMRTRTYWIEGFADRVRRGETLTLLCSSACTDEARCHRSIVKALLEAAALPPAAPERRDVVKRRRT
jgi:uncharacterized protein YeaO (DUF488 family)